MNLHEITLIIMLWILSISIMNGQETELIGDSALLSIELGEVVISGQLNREIYEVDDFQQQNTQDVSRTLGHLPSFQFGESGQRNEGMVYLRGFDLRSVPVFMDGIPIYVPYDGYVDLNRFTVQGLSKIEIAKGNASVLYGPNIIGGAINLISQKPQDKLEIKANAGLHTGRGKTVSLGLGTKREKYYLQGNISYHQQDHVKLSKDFVISDLEKDLNLDNSWSQDLHSSFKIGFIPRKTDEYSLNYIFQHGEKGNPIYLGKDPNIRLRYWQWPEWDKQSIYFVGKTKIAEKTFLKSRMYVDRFKNRLESFDDGEYETQFAKYAFTSIFKDRTIGAKYELSNNNFEDHLLNMVLQLKNDRHQEHNIGEAIRHFQDMYYVLGAEDVYTINDYLSLIPGFSYIYRQGLEAEDYDQQNNQITSFPIQDNSAYNYQLSLNWKPQTTFIVTGTAARKSRFATMNDRYSYKLGRAIPNPQLVSEKSFNFDISSEWKPVETFSFKSAIFSSHLDDVIQLVDEVEPGISQMQNSGEALFYGLDIEADISPFEFIRLTLYYTYIDRKNISNPTLYFRNVPRHKAISKFIVALNSKVRFSISNEYNSDRYSTSYGTLAESFFLWNFNTEVNITNDLALKFSLSNLMDSYYERVEGYPGEGRRFNIMFSYRT